MDSFAADDPSLADFAAEVEAFYDANAERTGASPEADNWGEGSDDTAIFIEIEPEADRRELAEAKAFRAKLFDAGLGWVTGPVQYGGRALDRRYDLVLELVASRYQAPSSRFFGIGFGMIAPTILAHAEEHIRARYLPGIYRGDVVACQLFSEPGAGSDLAGVATRAERRDGAWVINGQKVWTSGAQHSDIGEIIVRTNPSRPKHAGLSAFIVDMRTPGVEVRPLRQMTGGSSFNEVFFTDVVVPDDHLLGQVDDGWSVALTTLSNERATVGAGNEFSSRLRFMSFPRLIATLRHRGLGQDPALRQELARLYSAQLIAEWSSARALAALRAGQAPGPELSMAKLVRTNHMRRVGDFIGAVLGSDLVVDSGDWGTYAWSHFLLGVPGMRIAGGSDEIQYKIIGERVLGLPKEPAVNPSNPAT